MLEFESLAGCVQTLLRIDDSKDIVLGGNARREAALQHLPNAWVDGDGERLSGFHTHYGHRVVFEIDVLPFERLAFALSETCVGHEMDEIRALVAHLRVARGS